MKDSIALLVLAAVLLTAAASDLRSKRISNVLIVVGLISGLVLACLDGWRTLGFAAAGIATGSLLFLPAYALASMGAGDVKLMAVVGAFLGPVNTIIAAVATVIAGALLGIAVILARGGGPPMMRRYWRMLRQLCASGALSYIKPAENEVARAKLPYAVAIAFGTGWSVWNSGALSEFPAAARILLS